jgi:pilus assembly protein Flp/PilA
MWALIRACAKDEAGATSIEYAFIAILISVVIVGAITTIGTNLQQPFATAADGLK